MATANNVYDFKTKKQIIKDKSVQIIKDNKEDPERAVESIENMLCREAVNLGVQLGNIFLQKLVSWVEGKSSEKRKVVNIHGQR